MAGGTNPGTEEGGGKLQKQGRFTKLEAHASTRQLKKGLEKTNKSTFLKVLV